jgi:cell volume regulation protein A
MDVNSILLVVSLIVFLGYVAEWLFRKINVPDTLLLIVVGFAIGPNAANLFDPHRLGTLAPLFTTFTLLFLMFEGALYIDLRSFAEGIGAGITIGFSLFFISAAVISGIFYFLLNDLLLALMLGFALGGISSAFIIPILKQVKVDKKLYSVLTLESALTDVLAIVFATTMMELKRLNTFELNGVFSQIASLFFVAGMVGILVGFLWIFLERQQIIEGDRNYIMTIAYVVLLYFIAEYLGGNGAIAAMCFGMVIANSRVLLAMWQKVKSPKRKVVDEERVEKMDKSVNVVSSRERMFYREISFFLKTFFFVYIGILLNVRNLRAVGIGSGIAVVIMLLRYVSLLLTRKYRAIDRMLVNALFARGIAPAAILLVAMGKGLLTDPTIIDAVYVVITATIILSSIKIFLYKSRVSRSQAE